MTMRVSTGKEDKLSDADLDPENTWIRMSSHDRVVDYFSAKLSRAKLALSQILEKGSASPGDTKCDIAREALKDLE